MQKRFISICFCSLRTDWFCRRQPELATIPFVLSAPDHGRMVVTAANDLAKMQGIEITMAVADARALYPSLKVLDDNIALSAKLLNGIAAWCIRFTPSVAIDIPDGLLFDVTGCAHLWGGEKQYLTEINTRFKGFGYHVSIAIADTIGCAWAMARFTNYPQGQMNALLLLPPAALRIEPETIERLEKLGLRTVGSFINMARPSLRRRFGSLLLKRIDQALGNEEEFIIPVHPAEAYHERLPCMEPIVTEVGIEIALERLLDSLCKRLQQDGKGLRTAVFKGYRVDGKIVQLEIGTNRPTCNSKHLFKLFALKIDTLEPALGIELFTLDVLKADDLSAKQEQLWKSEGGLDDINLSELLDRIEGKIGAGHIHRYVPDEHYWPERSFKLATDILEKPLTPWKVDRPRPLQILTQPQPIDVTAPIPDYPPMNFRYKGKLLKVVKADGPERIEQEWWLQQGQHRDYYCVEDEEGHRYWLFRLGHYDAEKSYQWYMHGFFA
jgi:protein ImuB